MENCIIESSRSDQLLLLKKSLQNLLEGFTGELLLIFTADNAKFTSKVVIQGQEFSAVSSHCRHIIEVIYSIIYHNTKLIDYTDRKRDDSLVSSVKVFNQNIIDTIHRIDKIEPITTPLRKKDFLPDGEQTILIPTTIENELLYGLNHTVHHMAIIKQLTASMSLELPQSFGKAGSTISHDSKTIS